MTLEKFFIEKWDDVLPHFERLLEFVPHSYDEFEAWLADMDFVIANIEEEHAWRYIRKSLDTTNENFAQSFEYFLEHILPNVQLYKDKLNRKYMQIPFRKSISKSLKIYDRLIEKEITIFREENVELDTKCNELAAKYMEIYGKKTVDWNGKTLTLQQASDYLYDVNRDVRQKIWMKITDCRLGSFDKVNEIMDEMIRLRNQIAKNAGFSSYVDYIYQYLGRFDYNRADCESFHAAAELHIKPLWFELVQKRTESLGLGSIRPWDLDVDEKSRSPLVPFQTDVELVEKILAVFKAMDEEFYHFTLKMKCDGLLDVSSRIGKAPGGFNYPLPVTGAPFIFMNATNKHRDVSVLTHELGHAFHTFLSYRLAYRFQSNVPSEVAELASMSMELFASEYWDIFYPDKNDVSRALYDELTGIVRTLLWVACIDAFQHWLYEHPYHNLEARENAWQEIQNRFYGDSIDWSGIEDYRRGGWQKQLHIFEVPFYYIEYGIAQLGALRLWKNYKSNPSETLSKYKEALSLGYTATIPEIYETAGITFDFGADCVKEVVDFLRSEISACENV